MIFWHDPKVSVAISALWIRSPAWIFQILLAVSSMPQVYWRTTTYYAWCLKSWKPLAPMHWRISTLPSLPRWNWLQTSSQPRFWTWPARLSRIWLITVSRFGTDSRVHTLALDGPRLPSNYDFPLWWHLKANHMYYINILVCAKRLSLKPIYPYTCTVSEILFWKMREISK